MLTTTSIIQIIRRACGWGELPHSWDVFFHAGFEQTIVSPTGGMAPIYPRSIRFPNFDASSRAWYKDPAKMALLDSVAPASSVDAGDYEAIFFTGGHGDMYDFPGSEELKALTHAIYRTGGVVASVCHGYCALLETDLVRGQVLTGFSWAEEVLAGVADIVPYNVEQSMRERGATFRKGLIPFAPPHRGLRPPGHRAKPRFGARHRAQSG